MLKGTKIVEVNYGTVSKYSWEHYGDITISEGCQFVRYDSMFDEYIVIQLWQDDHTLAWFVTDTTITLNDYNDDIPEVKSYVGFQEGKDDYLYLANGFVDYFGSETLGGEYHSHDTIEEAIETLVYLQVIEEC